MLKKFLFRIKWRCMHPTASKKYLELMEGETKDAAQLSGNEEIARQKIVRYAMEHIAFYAQHYKAVGFEIGDIGKEGWFERLPVVTKKDLREQFDEFVNPELRQFMRISTTGGSTGEPTKTGYDGRFPEEAYSWRMQNRWGVHPWEDHAYVWRDRRKSFKAKFINALLWWPTRHLKMDATFMTDDGIKSFLARCRRVKPTMLQGYVGAITQVANLVVKEKVNLGSWKPKMVWTTSAPLSPVQRKLIEDAFGAPICNEYGSCECRWLASQVPGHEGLRVNTEHVSIEYVDENNQPVKPGEYGRALITNLEDTVFPLIRYENGDRGRWLDYPYIDEVKGRESESFVLPSGKTINGEYLTTIFDATPDLVRGFRVVQHRDSSITIEYIPNVTESCGCEMVEKQIMVVLENFAKCLGDEVPIEFKKVAEIPHDRGKLRFVVREK